MDYKKARFYHIISNQVYEEEPKSEPNAKTVSMGSNKPKEQEP